MDNECVLGRSSGAESRKCAYGSHEGSSCTVCRDRCRYVHLSAMHLAAYRQFLEEVNAVSGDAAVAELSACLLHAMKIEDIGGWGGEHEWEISY